MWEFVGYAGDEDATLFIPSPRWGREETCNASLANRVPPAILDAANRVLDVAPGRCVFQKIIYFS
jgi:hypothetical protein